MLRESTRIKTLISLAGIPALVYVGILLFAMYSYLKTGTWPTSWQNDYKASGFPIIGISLTMGVFASAILLPLNYILVIAFYSTKKNALEKLRKCWQPAFLLLLSYTLWIYEFASGANLLNWIFD